MILRCICRMLLTLAVGGVLLQSSTSCSDQFLNSLATGLSESLMTAIESGITAYIAELSGENA